MPTEDQVFKALTDFAALMALLAVPFFPFTLYVILEAAERKEAESDDSSAEAVLMRVEFPDATCFCVRGSDNDCASQRAISCVPKNDEKARRRRPKKRF